MGLRDILHWWSRSSINYPIIADDNNLIACGDADQLHEPLEHVQKSVPFDFHRASIRPDIYRIHSSLLTKAIHSDHASENSMKLVTPGNKLHSMRPRSIISTASLELSSDAETTSPSHSQISTLSQDQQYRNIFNFSVDNQSLNKAYHPINTHDKVQDTSPVDNHWQPNEKVLCLNLKLSGSADKLPSSATLGAAKSICNGDKTATTTPKSQPKPKPDLQPLCNPPFLLESGMMSNDAEKLLPRKPTIKFACHGPPPPKLPAKSDINSNSLSSDSKFLRISQLVPTTPPVPFVNPIKTVKPSRSSLAICSLQVKEENKDVKEIPGLSEATRFHEFASGEMEVDDWVRRDIGDLTRKLTINDTMEKENEIRRLACEAEEEELEEEEAVAASNDEEENEQEEDEYEYDSEDSYFSGYYCNQSNEVYNKAGLVNADKSAKGYFTSRSQANGTTEPTPPLRRHVLSNSSEDSLPHRYTVFAHRNSSGTMKHTHLELPDSTDFVCGTLDEDQPLEKAYLSCMEARKQARYKKTPQDIDPSFPDSDSDVEMDDDSTTDDTSDEQEHLYRERLDERNDGRKSPTFSRNRASIGHYSPKKLHSPPPLKQRHKPTSSRKFFSSSPRCSQPSNPNNKASQEEALSSSRPIVFSPHGTCSRPTYTKSLPRLSNHFYRSYHTDCRKILTDYENEDSNPDNHVRGALDIVKGLEHKRQRRKEKLYSKQTTQKFKSHSERKTQPGEGAERMREVGLFMAGKAGTQKPFIISA